MLVGARPRIASLAIAVVVMAGVVMPVIASQGRPDAGGTSWIQALAKRPKPTPTPVPTASPAPSPLVTPAASAPASPTPVPSAPPTPAPSASASPTPAPTATPRPTSTPAPKPRATARPARATPATAPTSTPSSLAAGAGASARPSADPASLHGALTSDEGGLTPQRVRWLEAGLASLLVLVVVTGGGWLILRRRGDGRSRPPDLAAAAAVAAPALTSAPAAVRRQASPEEAGTPRWLRASVRAERFAPARTELAPRRYSAMREATTFDHPADAAAIRMLVRYDGVALLDQTNEVFAQVISELGTGDEVEIVDVVDVWAEVQTPHGYRGWVPTMTLRAPQAGGGAS